MADIGNFLFGSQPAPLSITGQTTNISGVPDWYQDYTKQLIAKANAIASEPYTPYPGTRMAGLNEKDRQAGQMVQSNIGSWQPYINQASGSYTNASGMMGAGSAKPYMERSAGMSSVGAAQPLVNQAAGASAFNAAMPYTSGATKMWPQGMSEYMSPYTGAVVNEIGRLGNQNLTENILPEVNQTFTGGGMFGSSRHADFTNRAIRDASKAIAGEQAKALESGYGTSANIFGQDMSRLAGIGQTMGGLASSDYGRQLEAGKVLGGLTGDDATRLATIGGKMGDLTQSDMRNLMDLGSRQAALGQQRSQLGTADASGIAALGQTERDLTQKMLDMKYGDFLKEQADPWTKIANLSAVTRGQQLPTVSTSTNVGTGATSPSLATNLISSLGILGKVGGYY